MAITKLNHPAFNTQRLLLAGHETLGQLRSRGNEGDTRRSGNFVDFWFSLCMFFFFNGFLFFPLLFFVVVVVVVLMDFFLNVVSLFSYYYFFPFLCVSLIPG